MNNLKKIFDYNLRETRILLVKKEVEYWIDDFYQWFFCNLSECNDYELFLKKGETLKDQLVTFLKQLQTKESTIIANQFFEKLNDIHKILQIDLQVILNFDPAAKSKEEVLISYPGFFTIAIHRISHELWLLEIPILPRLIMEYVHSKTGIDIHPGATIGEGFFIDHGTGIVIGETATIGKNVKIYQGVTLGALAVIKTEVSKKRHPTIENDVVIYANATILGGNTVIGAYSVIGGNVWITSNVLPHSLVFHKADTIIKTKIDYSKIIDFSI
jgi:serine O-acetyltransferase